MEFLINYGVFIALVLLGFTTGTIVERRHYARIRKREAESDVMVFSDRNVPDGMGHHTQQLVIGSVVLSNDYFKAMLAGLRKLFGGNIGAYETLLDRGRREAVLRLKDEASALNAKMVINVKFETSSISKGDQNNLTTIEVMAYGTALI